MGGRRWALYGATPSSAKVFGDALRQTRQELVVTETGRASEWSPSAEGARCVANGVQSVFIAISQPHTEIFAHNFAKSAPNLQVIGVGAGIEMFGGEMTRAPKWVQRFNMEWAFRLFQDPRRLWTRYVRQGIPLFVRSVLPALVRRNRNQGG